MQAKRVLKILLLLLLALVLAAAAYAAYLFLSWRRVEDHQDLEVKTTIRVPSPRPTSHSDHGETCLSSETGGEAQKALPSTTNLYNY